MEPTQDDLKRMFQEILRATQLESWEFFAPRSRIASRRNEVYKLFLREKGSTEWWLFEDRIWRDRSDDPHRTYAHLAKFLVFYGSANMLEFLNAQPPRLEPQDSMLVWAFAEIHQTLQERKVST